MASDGKIIIETKLDTTGFEKDVDTASKKVADDLGKGTEKAMKQAEESVKNIGKAVKNIDFSNISKQMDSISKNIEKTSTQLDKQKEKLNNLKKAYENTTDIKDKNKIASQMEKAEASITKLENKLNSLNNKKIELNAAKDAINDLDGNFSSASMSITKSLDRVDKKAQETGKNVKKSFENIDISKGIIKAGESISDVGDELTNKVTLPVMGLGVVAAKIGMDFDSGMSRVKAISGATGEEFTKLHDQALQLGADTAFSAKEAAEGMENLASAGFSTNEIMSAMPGLLNLAASSGESLASSSDIAASTLRGFGLEASETAHVADVLAKNASATNAAVVDTGEAMKYIAPVAHSMGLGLEEVTAAIGEMANAGIKGSQAGTTLRSALTRLASPSDPAAQAMDSIGFSAFNAEGKLNSLSTIIKEYSEALEGKTDQEKQDLTATIFGQEAMSGMLTLIENGSSALDDLTNSYKTADGAAEEMAKTMQDNSKSSIEQMVGSLETAAIKLEEVAAPSIINIANEVQELANEFSELSPEVQQQVIEFALLAAAVGPVAKVVGTVTSGIGTLVKIGGKLGALLGLIETGAAGGTAALGGLAVASGVAVAAASALVVGVAAYSTAQYQMHEKLTTTTDDMTAWGKAINGLTGYTFKSKKELQDLGVEYKEFGDNISDDFKDKVEDATLAINKFQLFLGKINLDGIIDSAESSDFNSQVNKMVDDAINSISSKKSEVQKSLSDMFKLDDNSIDATEQSVIDMVSKGYDTQIDEENKLKTEILAIKEKAVEEKRALNEQEIKDVQDKLNRVRQIELEAVGGTQEENDYAKNEFGARVESVNPEDASKLLEEKRKALDEENVKIKASYDTQLDLLKRNLESASDENKAAIQEEIDKFTKLRDDKVKLKQDEWQQYINILKEKNPEALAFVNEFNGEELTKQDQQAQQKLSKMEETFKELNSITESGTYQMWNTQTNSAEAVTVAVDESTGKIIGAYSETSAQVGGYTAQMANDVQNLGQEHATLSAECQTAMQELSDAHINTSGQIVNSSGHVVGALKDIVTENGNVVSGIYDLNGTPIEIQTNADGTISNLQDVISKIAQIPDTKYVTIQISQKGMDYGASEGSRWLNSNYHPQSNNYTGTTTLKTGLSYVNEHKWETANNENVKLLGNNLAFLIGNHYAGGDGINDHMTSVNEMNKDITKAVDNRFSSIVAKLINAMYAQSNALNQVASNTKDIKDNGTKTIQLNEQLAKDIVNQANSQLGSFSGLEQQLRQAQYEVDNANIINIDNNEAYATAKAELDRLNDLTSKERKALGDDEYERQKDYAQKAVDTAKQQAELEIEVAKNAAKQKQEIAEQNKEALTKIAEATTTAIKNQLEEEKAAAEKVHQDRLDQLEEEYNKEIANIDKVTAKKISAIDEQLAALEEETTETSREEERQVAQDDINVLTAKMNNTASVADKRAYALQIENAKKELEQKENEWDIEDERTALEEEKALLEEKAQAKKEKLQEEYEDQKAAEEEKLKATDKYYDKLLETDSLNAQVRYTLLTSSNDELVMLLNSYAPQWQDAGQTLADSLINGLNSQELSTEDAVKNLISIRSSGSSASSSTTGYASGTSSNPYAGFYNVDEEGFEISDSDNAVAYVSQGAAIKNHMQSEQFIKSEISRQVAAMKLSVLEQQANMQSLLVGSLARSTNNNIIKNEHNQNAPLFHAENVYFRNEDDIEQMSYKLGFYSVRNRTS